MGYYFLHCCLMGQSIYSVWHQCILLIVVLILPLGLVLKCISVFYWDVCHHWEIIEFFPIWRNSSCCLRSGCMLQEMYAAIRLVCWCRILLIGRQLCRSWIWKAIMPHQNAILIGRRKFIRGSYMNRKENRNKILVRGIPSLPTLRLTVARYFPSIGFYCFMKIFIYMVQHTFWVIQHE